MNQSRNFLPCLLQYMQYLIFIYRDVFIFYCGYIHGNSKKIEALINSGQFLLQVIAKVGGVHGVHSHSVRNLATVIKEIKLVQGNVTIHLLWEMAKTVADLVLRYKSAQLLLRIVLVMFQFHSFFSFYFFPYFFLSTIIPFILFHLLTT